MFDLLADAEHEQGVGEQADRRARGDLVPIPGVLQVRAEGGTPPVFGVGLVAAELDESLREGAEEAADVCPMQAITLDG